MLEGTKYQKREGLIMSGHCIKSSLTCNGTPNTLNLLPHRCGLNFWLYMNNYHLKSSATAPLSGTDQAAASGMPQGVGMGRPDQIPGEGCSGGF